jgi:hypothetical protein
MKKMMIGVLVSSLLGATTPLCAESASITGALSPASVQSSIERAVVLVDAGAPAALPAPHPLSVSVRQQFASTSAAPAAAGAAQAGPAAGGGGGGHSLATILTLVGTAVSVGGAIYYMKVIKKATSQVPSN